MKLSTRSLYGMRALVELALTSSQRPASATHIAKRQSLSIAYLEQLLHRLRKGGLLTSIRGPRGGYVLARAPHQISMVEVVRILDGEQGFWEEAVEPGNWPGDDSGDIRVTCRSGKGSAKALSGEREKAPRHAQQINIAVKRCVHARLAESLGAVTLEDLCNEVRSLDDAPLEHRYVFHI